MTENSGYQGQMLPNSSAGQYNAISFVASQLLNKMNTSALVEVVSCTNDGGLSPVGRVDVTFLVNQVDGQGNPIPHGTTYDLPYMRIQGGANAIIIDPEPGDIGVAVFASRDISIVKSTKARAMPGSARKYDPSDGMYIGGMLNGTPQQFVQFSAGGITITSPQKVTVNAPVVEINASTSVDITAPVTTINGELVVTNLITGEAGAAISGGDVIVTGGDVKADDISLKLHRTSGVTPGGGISTAPVV